MEENVNLEFKVHNSGTDQVLGVAYINSSELIKCYKERVSQELKIYIHGSKA